MNSPVKLGVSPAVSTPMGVFTQKFEALFPKLGCMVCFTSPLFLPVYLCTKVGPWGLLAVALPAPFVPQSAKSLDLAALPWVLCALLPFSALPTGLDECFFFISLIIGLPYGSIFCQFSLFFVFKLLLSFFGCARRRSVSTYASILVLLSTFTFLNNCLFFMFLRLNNFNCPVLKLLILSFL